MKPSKQVVILREILDIKEGYLNQALKAGVIILDPRDKKRLAKLEVDLAKLRAW